MTKKLILIAITLAALIVAGLSFQIIKMPIEASASSSDTFILDVPYEKVRSILIQTKATPKIVAANDGILLEEKWSTGSLDIGPRPLRDGDWRLKLYGLIKIKMNDPRIGSPIGEFNQKVDVNPDRMIVETILIEPAGKIMHYYNTLILTKRGNVTEVKLEINLMINYEHIPLHRVKQIINDNVQEAANSLTKNTGEKLKQIIDEHKDATFILDLSRLYKSEVK